MFPDKSLQEGEVFTNVANHFGRDYTGNMETDFTNFEGDESVFWYENHPLTAYSWPFSTMALPFY